MISDIPPFDLALSHDLYKTLLEPVKAGWSDAKSLIVVTNGALGLLPLGVLTVAPHELSSEGADSLPAIAPCHGCRAPTP